MWLIGVYVILISKFSGNFALPDLIGRPTAPSQTSSCKLTRLVRLKFILAKMVQSPLATPRNVSSQFTYGRGFCSFEFFFIFEKNFKINFLYTYIYIYISICIRYTIKKNNNKKPRRLPVTKIYKGCLGLKQ